ncbi:hypothetical protein IWQ60_007619 [Tieghemiomyces parasiticus]|uniref:AAA+ ATPase domain-containing protein n=1 Tax=Tieghemiomyces parasiticus TaxID=78921 RepID=A0A9W8A2U5_9FUNG|nr:hypothetical protein IWQ60_007619 [Tieghemiomyces parasiticus]
MVDQSPCALRVTLRVEPFGSDGAQRELWGTPFRSGRPAVQLNIVRQTLRDQALQRFGINTLGLAAGLQVTVISVYPESERFQATPATRISLDTSPPGTSVKPPQSPASLSGTDERSLDGDLDTDQEPSAPTPLLPGLESAHRDLRDILLYPLRYAHLFQHLGVECPKGVLLYGPPGVGKTWLVSNVARECRAHLRTINGSEVVGTYIGESEQNLRDAFTTAQQLAEGSRRPCVLFIDEVDALAPQRDGADQHASRVIAQLLTLMDGLAARGRLIVVAATNRPNALDPALRRPGRFDREVAIGVPTVAAREAILRYHTRHLSLSPTLDLGYLATLTNGYVGADLAALCREATQSVIRRQFRRSPVVPGAFTSQRTGAEDKTVGLSLADFQAALTRVGPSMQRGLALDVAPLTWDDVGGLAEVKQQLRQAVEWPLQYRDTFDRLGLRPPRGILLYGPPGCSKTTLVKVVASCTQASFFSLNGAALYSPFVGDSERTVRDLFRRARAGAPSVIFFDEMDAVVGKRALGGSSLSSGGDVVQERLLTMLLNEMDGMEATQSVLVIGATNRPDMIDAALLRPGRFDRLVYVPPPDYDARCQILSIATATTPLDGDVDLSRLAQSTERFSGADLTNLCREAALLALAEHRTADSVAGRHFQRALAQARPSISPASLTWYDRFRQGLGQ